MGVKDNVGGSLLYYTAYSGHNKVVRLLGAKETHQIQLMRIYCSLLRSRVTGKLSSRFA